MKTLPAPGQYAMKGTHTLVRVVTVDEDLGLVTHVDYVQVRYDGEVIGGGSCLGGMRPAEFRPITDPESMLAADVHRAQREAQEARDILARREQEIAVKTAAIRAVRAAAEAVASTGLPSPGGFAPPSPPTPDGD